MTIGIGHIDNVVNEGGGNNGNHYIPVEDNLRKKKKIRREPDENEIDIISWQPLTFYDIPSI